MTKVLSVKQPHAFLLAIGVKPIENRTWKLPEKYKGERVLIHSSDGLYKRLNYTEQQYESIKSTGIMPYDMSSNIHRSAIIGSVRFVDCVINHESIWAEKTDIPLLGDVLDDLKHFGRAIPPRIIYNWLSADPILFDKPILNVKGKLGFWEYSHPMCCPICGYPLHLQKTGDIITDAFCFTCKKDVLYYEKILCPYCGKVCLHDNSDVGVPNWGNPVHECEHCKEMILESEFKILK